MSADLPLNASEFSGLVRLFPLPNFVLFPHVIAPLHIFEPRYRDLMNEAVATDHALTLAVLAPGWEANYEGRPPILPVACYGRVSTSHRLPDGRWNLLVVGCQRVRIIEELPPTKSFREARAELLADHYSSDGAADRQGLHRELVDAFSRFVKSTPGGPSETQGLLNSELSLGALADVLAFALDLGLDTKARLLAETNVDVRARTLLHHLRGDQTGHRLAFPPRFSVN